MNRWPAAVLGAIVLAAAASCAVAPVPGGITVIVGGPRANSAAGSWTPALDARFDADAAAGRSWTFVTADGRPAVRGGLPLRTDAANDLTRQAGLAALRLRARAQLAAATARAPESDLLGALDLAARALTDAAPPRTVIVLDSLLSTTGPLRFADDGGALLAADPTAVAERLAAARELPDLTGVTVDIAGAGDTVAPQDALPAPTRAALLAIWTAVLTRSGASVHIDQAPAVPAAASGLPAVTPVPIAPPVPTPEPIVIRDDTVGFLPDQAVLRDPAAATLVLEPVAAWLRDTRRGVALTGTTSSAGTPEGRVSLSLQRAGVIADLLVAAGVARTAIHVAGVGDGFPSFVPDRDAAGHLDPVRAARNRLVIIDTTPPATAG